MTQPTKALLGRAEAAGYLDVSVTLFDDLRRSREFPELKIGQKPKWRIKDLDSYIDRQVRKASV